MLFAFERKMGGAKQISFISASIPVNMQCNCVCKSDLNRFINRLLIYDVIVNKTILSSNNYINKIISQKEASNHLVGYFGRILSR